MATRTQARTSSGRYENKGTRTATKGMKHPPAGKKAATITLHHDGKGGLEGSMSKARCK